MRRHLIPLLRYQLIQGEQILNDCTDCGFKTRYELNTVLFQLQASFNMTFGIPLSTSNSDHTDRKNDGRVA